MWAHVFLKLSVISHNGPKTFLKSPLNFSLPLQFQEIFSYFLHFQYLVKLINFIQMQLQDGFWFHCIFCKESRAIENKNNTSIRGRVSQNSSPKANEITNFEKFLKSMAQTKYIDGRQNIQTSSENIPDTFGNSSTLDLLRKFHTAHFSRHKLHQVLLYKVWCHMGPFPIHIYIFSHYLPHWHG